MARTAAWMALTLALGFVPALALGAEPAGSLTAVITGVRSDAGDVYCAIYGSSDGFPHRYKKAIRGLKVPASRGTVRCPFGPLPPGDYAVSVMHDENGNGELDTRIFGIPKEGWGVSNDAGPHTFGPPKYDEARFQHGPGADRVTIRLRY